MAEQLNFQTRDFAELNASATQVRDQELAELLKATDQDVINDQKDIDDRHGDDDDDDNDDDDDDDGDEADKGARQEQPASMRNDANDTLGVSMGRSQTRMKDPGTPAITKSQALETSRDYFTPTLTGTTHFFEEPLHEDESEDIPQFSDRRASVTAGSNEVDGTMSSPQGAATLDQKSPAQALKSSSKIHPRDRSSSVSRLVQALKRVLPGNKSTPTANPGSKNGETVKSMTPEVAVEQPSQHTKDLLPMPEKSMATRPQLDRDAPAEQSLYLKRAATGADNFDDYEVYAQTHDMANSRAKAVRDSLQDSALRLPGLSGLASRSNLAEEDSKSASNHEPNIKTGRSMVPGMTGSKAVNRADAPKSKRHPILAKALSHMEGDLVVMGGYRGSILREAQPPHRQLWAPIKVGINVRKADLEVGLTLADEMNMEKTIIPSGSLSHIGPIDISRRLIRKCSRCKNCQDNKLRVHDFGYDWRLSPHVLSAKITTFLMGLRCNQPSVPPEKRGAWVIAHSLGGLIMRHVINRHPELVAGIIYAGSPQNCVNILGPIRNGDNVLFSSRVLTAQVNFTLRTSYALLPLNGQCFINKKTKERYDVDFFDLQTWQRHRLSPCIKPPRRRGKSNTQQASTSVTTGSADPQTETPVHNVQRSEDTAEEVVDALEDTVANAKPQQPLSPTIDASHKPEIATTSTIPVPVAEEYLTRTLAEVKQFKQETHHNPKLQRENMYPPAALIYARNTPTVYGAFVASQDAIQYDDAFDDLAFAAGDGVVLASAAQLPVGYKVVRGGRVVSERGHVGLLGDLEGIGKCLLAIHDGRRRGIGLGT